MCDRIYRICYSCSLADFSSEPLIFFSESLISLRYVAQRIPNQNNSIKISNSNIGIAAVIFIVKPLQLELPRPPPGIQQTVNYQLCLCEASAFEVLCTFSLFDMDECRICNFARRINKNAVRQHSSIFFALRFSIG